jgi:Zn-dependent protease
MSDLPPPFLIGLIVVLLLSLSWHEAAHAWVADRLGDPTARSLGRVTLNPIRHMDLFLSVLLPLMLYLVGSPVFGGGKPVPIDVRNFRHRSRDFMLVAVAGPFSNLLLAGVFGLLYVFCVSLGMFQDTIPNPYGAATLDLPSIVFPEERIPSRFWLQAGMQVNIFLAIFNLIPVPPLDGSRIVGWLLPRKLQPFWYRIDRIGLFLVIGLIAFLYTGGMQYIGAVMTSAWIHVADAVDALAFRVAQA